MRRLPNKSGLVREFLRASWSKQSLAPKEPC